MEGGENISKNFMRWGEKPSWKTADFKYNALHAAMKARTTKMDKTAITPSAGVAVENPRKKFAWNKNISSAPIPGQSTPLAIEAMQPECSLSLPMAAKPKTAIPTNPRITKITKGVLIPLEI